MPNGQTATEQLAVAAVLHAVMSVVGCYKTGRLVVTEPGRQVVLTHSLKLHVNHTV